MAFRSRGSEVYVDILIVGAGPSGLMAAATLARYGVDFRIIEKRPIPIQAGYVENIQPRTLEILQTLGLRHALDEEGSRMHEHAFWTHDSNGALQYESKGQGVVCPTVYPYTVVGPISDVLRKKIENNGHGVEYSKELLGYRYENVLGEIAPWPIQAFVQNHVSRFTEVWHATYVLGCDGTGSIVRKCSGVEDHIYSRDGWAFIDVDADTNFPDIRRKCTIKSILGSCIFLPQKGNNTRVATTVTGALQNVVAAMHDNEGGNSSALPLVLLSRIQAVLSPHTFEVKEAYSIRTKFTTKHLAAQFSDPSSRIFLLGSASHTHSPSTFQSVNSGIVDAHNLTWKLALVHKGLAHSSILQTFTTERRPIAQRSLDSESKLDHVFHLPPSDPAVLEGIYDFYETSNLITGCGAQCPPSNLVREEVRTLLKKVPSVLTPGCRLLVLPRLTRHIDGHMVDLLSEMPSNGLFHLVLFAGALLFTPSIIELALYLALPESPLTSFVSSEDVPLVDLYLMHTSSHFVVSLSDLPLLFSLHQRHVYEDVGGKAHEFVGVSPKLGALVLVRPDGVVAMVTNLDDGRGINDMLGNFLVRKVQGVPARLMLDEDIMGAVGERTDV